MASTYATLLNSIQTDYEFHSEFAKRQPVAITDRNHPELMVLSTEESERLRHLDIAFHPRDVLIALWYLAEEQP